MAQRLTDRTELLTINDADWIHVVDVSDLTDDPEGTSKKITRSNFLAGISTDANTLDGQDGTFYLNRTNHTGTQDISTVSGLQGALDVKQPLDADLTSIAGLSGTSGLLRKTAANTWTLDTASYLRSDQSGTLTGTLTLTGNLVASAVNTGQGTTEVYNMNQNVRTTDSVTFANISGSGAGITDVNATTLNNLDSTQFLRSDTSDTMSGILTVTQHVFATGSIPFRAVGTGTGTANSTFIGFYESNGTVRQGYVGMGSGANSDVYLQSDNANVRLNASGATRVTVSSTSMTTTVPIVTTSIDTGLGATEVYLMDQNVRSTDFVSFGRVFINDVAANSFGLRLDSNNVNFSGIYFSSAEDGQLYLRSAAGTASILSPDGAGGFSTGGNIVCGQINTGQGLTEVYAMNQPVRTTDNITAASFITGNWTMDQVGNDLVFSYNGAEKLRILSTGGATETV